MPWDMTPAEPDVLSLDSLIAWLETMPADVEYSMLKPASCLLGQWAARFGLKPAPYTSRRYGNVCFPDTFAEIAFFHSPYTFGAALDRARALRDAS